MTMKKFVTLILVLVMMSAAALADSAVLLVELPQDAQMIEDIRFDDGDFIQTYQAGGMTVQLLRYASFDMSIDELIGSEWTGAANVTALALDQIGGYPASGVQLSCVQEGQGALDVTLVRVDTGDGVLVFEAVAAQGDAGAAQTVEAMLASMSVLADDAPAAEDEVG